MKYKFFLLTAVISFPVIAQTSAKELYVSAVIGAFSIVGLFFIVGVYRLWKIFYSKAKLAYRNIRERDSNQRPRTTGASLNASMSISLSTPSFKSGSEREFETAPVSSVHPAIENKNIAAKNTVCTSLNLTTKITTPSSPTDDFWSTALLEFDSSDRRIGLWAKVFAEAHGNELVAKARYLEVRAQELQKDALQQEEGIRLDAQKLETDAALIKALAVDPASFKTVTDCEAHFRALGFCVLRAAAEKWEVSGRGLGTSFLYSLEDLQRHAIMITRLFRKKQEYFQSGQSIE